MARSYQSQEACSAFHSIQNHKLIQRHVDFSGVLLVISQTCGSDSLGNRQVQLLVKDEPELR